MGCGVRPPLVVTNEKAIVVRNIVLENVAFVRKHERSTLKQNTRQIMANSCRCYSDLVSFRCIPSR